MKNNRKRLTKLSIMFYTISLALMLSTSVWADPKPIAAFTVDPFVSTSPVMVHLNASKSRASQDNDHDRSIVEYEWRSSDGQIGYGLDFFILFENAGYYTITLKVTNDRGNWSTYSQTLTITDESDDPAKPIAAFTVDPLVSKSSVMVHLNGSKSRASEDNDHDRWIVEYEWRASDGQIGYGLDFFILFENAGYYTISLKVTNDLGNWSTSSQTLTVTDESDDPEVPPFYPEELVHAFLSPTDGRLYIPAVDVKNIFGGIISYAVVLEWVPGSDPATFVFISAELVKPDDYVTHSFFSPDGILEIPVVDVPNVFAGVTSYKVALKLLDADTLEFELIYADIIIKPQPLKP